MSLHLNRGSINLRADDLDIRDVLGELFTQMGVGYDIPPEVQGHVTVDLHNLTYAQALDIILLPRYTYHIGPHDIIYVHRAGTTWRPGQEHAA